MEHCPQCKQKIRKLNPHRMCKHKVTVLEIMAKANGWVVAQHGHGIVVNGVAVRAPYRAEAHASRLVWFGLAEHGAPRSGMYRITQEGRNFLAGMHVVPRIIWCKDGVVVEEHSQKVAIGNVKNVVLDKEYWDNYSSYQRSHGNP
jgi:hypothetical protein